MGAIRRPLHLPRLPTAARHQSRQTSHSLALAAAGKPVTPADVAKSFKRGDVDQIEELLDTLASLGQARQLDDDKYVA